MPVRSVRSVRGFLATVLVACAVVALGLGAVRPVHSPDYVDTLAGSAWMLRGWRVAAAALAVAVGVWVVGAGLEGGLGTRGARIAAGLLVLSTPVLSAAADDAYWDGRGLGVAWRADGRGDASPAGEWRALLGGECGYGSVVRVTLDASGRGRGTSVPVYAGAPLLTAVVALSPLDGPRAVPVTAALQGDTLRVRAAVDTGWYRAGDMLGNLPLARP